MQRFRQRGDDKPIGLVSLTRIDSIHRNAELHLLIGRKDKWGRGLGTAAMRAMVRHAFDNLNLQRLEVRVLADHPAIIEFAKRADSAGKGSFGRRATRKAFTRTSS